MANIQIIQGDFEKKLKLQFAPGIRAGFPSPAEDYNHDTLDFNRDLIRNPEATFYGKVEGDSMIEAGINDGDIAVIDRSLEPRDGDIVVSYINEEFTIKYLDLNHHNDGYIEWRPANKDFIRKQVSSSWELGLTVQFSRTCLTQMLNSLKR